MGNAKKQMSCQSFFPSLSFLFHGQIDISFPHGDNLNNPFHFIHNVIWYKTLFSLDEDQIFLDLSMFYFSWYTTDLMSKFLRWGEIVYNWAIGLMNSVFANGLGDWGSIPGQVIPKTQKIKYHITVYKVFVLRIVTWSYNILLRIIISF